MDCSTPGFLSLINHIYALCLTPESIWVRCPQISKPQAADCGGMYPQKASFARLSWERNFHLLKNKVPTQNLESKPTGIAQMPLIKEKIIRVHLSFFLFPFSRVTCNCGPHLGHFGEHSMWILVCKDHSVYIDWPVQQYTDQYNFLHLNGVHDFLHW